MKANEMCKIIKNAFGEYMYSIGYTFQHYLTVLKVERYTPVAYNHSAINRKSKKFMLPTFLLFIDFEEVCDMLI